MSDIFEIKGVDAVLRIRGVTYKFADPCFPEKVKLRKLQKELQKKMSEAKAEDVDFDDISLQYYEINKKMIKQYLPDLGDDVLNSLGEYDMSALLVKLADLASENFGAVVQKVEEKKS